MKTHKVLFLLVFVTTIIVGNIKAQSFDSDAAQWHKKAIMTCGMIKSVNPDSAFLNKNLAELETEFDILLKKYINNPPAEYAKDANWNSYLFTLKENLMVVKERAERKEYAKASIFCPYFCTTFGKIHKINGTTDITDLMFSWRMEIKNTTDMFNAGNNSGALHNLETVDKLYQNILKKKTTVKIETFEEIFKPIDQVYLIWIDAVRKENTTEINQQFNSFMKLFAKPYLSTL